MKAMTPSETGSFERMIRHQAKGGTVSYGGTICIRPPVGTLLGRGLLAGLLLWLPLWTQPLLASGLFSDRDDVQVAAREEIAAAMSLEQEHDYDLSATSNGTRLLTGVIMKLVEWHAERDAEQQPILIDHRDYFAAFLGVTQADPEDAPVFLRIAHEHGEDQLIDYRRDRVVRRVSAEPELRVAVNVVAGWKDGPRSYSYEDKTNKPHLKATHKRRNTYRILDFGDFYLFDDIQGITGRATSGLLGLMFNVLGEARAVRSRSAVSEDGLQITRTTAKKFGLPVKQTATVYPNGRVEKGLPPNRPDLVAIEKLLRKPLEIEYQPLE